jgi:hypothetical protein
MFAEMVCTCGATLQLDVDEVDFPAWVLTSRFAEAHVKCGFISPMVSDTPEKTSRYELKFKPRTNYLSEEE